MWYFSYLLWDLSFLLQRYSTFNIPWYIKLVKKFVTEVNICGFFYVASASSCSCCCCPWRIAPNYAVHVSLWYLGYSMFSSLLSTLWFTLWISLFCTLCKASYHTLFEGNIRFLSKHQIINCFRKAYQHNNICCILCSFGLTASKSDYIKNIIEVS